MSKWEAIYQQRTLNDRWRDVEGGPIPRVRLGEFYPVWKKLMVETSGRVEKPDYPEQNAVTMHFLPHRYYYYYHPLLIAVIMGIWKGEGERNSQPTRIWSTPETQTQTQNDQLTPVGRTEKKKRTVRFGLIWIEWTVIFRFFFFLVSTGMEIGLFSTWYIPSST